jgi:oligopeptide/dipeptide ABC transporter ATP-binding protein
VTATFANGASADGSATADRDVLLSVNDLVQTYTTISPGYGKRTIQAVSGVSFDIRAGETLALVGESGCGKSTLARTVLQAPPPKSGSVVFRGETITGLRDKQLRKALLGMQVVFQDPYGSLDPHWRVADLISEPLRIQKMSTPKERLDRAEELMVAVGLDPVVHGKRRPRELSGGQCQRVAIARALGLNPSLLVCDEPVSALDVSVQAQILNLFERLRKEFSLSYLFITHDLAVAKHVSDSIAVMYLGKLMEIGPAADIYRAPLHPYSAALLSAIPDPDSNISSEQTVVRLQGDLPSAANPPSGCRFRTRCPLAQEKCAEQEPPLVEMGPGHKVACHFPLTGVTISEAALRGRDRASTGGAIE